VTAVHEHIAAFNAHDTARLLAGFAPEAVWITGADRFTGHAQLADVFNPWLWSLAPQLSVLGLVIAGDEAAARLHESLTVEGERREFDIAVFFEFTDGLIRWAKVYREGSADL
jgi:uncharacterized protein